MDTLTTALMWRDLGVATIPILARSKLPAIDKWKPYQSRLPSEFELRAWFGRPGYNIAVVTGWQGLVIVDFDSIAAWKHFNSTSLCAPHTYTVLTPRGRHLYFYCAETTQCVSLDGIDIKGGGGYCLAPPSIHPSGRVYTSIFHLDEIAYLDSITDFIPEYQQAIDRPPPRQRAGTLHPLDAAMLPHTDISFEEANDRLSWKQLLPVGRRKYGAYLCPFHNENTPSFVLYPDEHWYCFGCQAHGRDKLDLYAQLNGMTIAEALCTL